jgi:HAD superfamily hydrolase (TIGR01450 family)
VSGGGGLDFDGLIVDLDGVVWIGPSAVPGSVEALVGLRARGVPLVFLTNDPVSSRAEYAARLRYLGIEASEGEIVSAGSALASLLHEREGSGTTAFVIGSRSLKSEIAAAGLALLDGDDGRDADVVAVGGHGGFDYAELRTATQAVRRGARLYACGRDATFPMPDGPWPATGAIVAAVETASGVTATAVGKPEPAMFEAARAVLGAVDRIAVVGDNPASDIEGGRRAGLATILVDASGVAREPQPDFVVSSLADLLEESSRD